MSTNRKEQQAPARQSEAHTVPPLPKYEYQTPVYGSPGDNSTSSQSAPNRDYELGTISLGNLNF